MPLEGDDVPKSLREERRVEIDPTEVTDVLAAYVVRKRAMVGAFRSQLSVTVSDGEARFVVILHPVEPPSSEPGEQRGGSR